MTDPRTGHSLTEIRTALNLGQTDLANTYLARPDHKAYLSGRTALVDRLLTQLWSQAEMPASTTLIAVGGYVRGELYPHSDIDVLIALDAPPSPALEETLQQLISKFWDIGLAVGHSIRTINECIESAHADVTVQTALFESRFIFCIQALYLQL